MLYCFCHQSPPPPPPPPPPPKSKTTMSSSKSTDRRYNVQSNTDMMTSSNGNIFRVTGPLYGEFTGLRWIPRTKASDAELDVFCDLRLIKRLSKHSRDRWFETPSRPLWRHCNDLWCCNCNTLLDIWPVSDSPAWNHFACVKYLSMSKITPCACRRPCGGRCHSADHFPGRRGPPD